MFVLSVFPFFFLLGTFFDVDDYKYFWNLIW